MTETRKPHEVALEALQRCETVPKGPWENDDDSDRVLTGYFTERYVGEDGTVHWHSKDSVAQDIRSKPVREFVAQSITDVPVLANAVLAMTALLRRFAPKCFCGAYATQQYDHVAGYRIPVCDRLECRQEPQCEDCGQHTSRPHFNADGVKCSGTTQVLTTEHVFELQEFPHADVLRSL